MQELISRLQPLLPKSVTFQKGTSFYWSPKDAVITYNASVQDPLASTWSLLHEAAHALLDHQGYSSDLTLLLLEVEAWEKAASLGQELGIAIDNEHIQDCLDTYRDWLHQRSTCPRCSVVSLQISTFEYLCHNCDASWRVSASRFCRPYRLLKHGQQSKSHPGTSRATFR